MIIIERETIGNNKEIKLTFQGGCRSCISFDTFNNQVGNRFTFWLTPEEADKIAFQLNSALQDIERTQSNG